MNTEKRMNVRYNIHADLVKEQITKKLGEHAKFRHSWMTFINQGIEKYKTNPECFTEVQDEAKLARLNLSFDNSVREEIEYYSKVRIIKLARAKYVLVYGDEDDNTVQSGTGPFKSLKEARAWFLEGGR